MTHASIDAKIHATFLAVGMLDALGNPLQNQPRVPNRIIDEMLPHPTADRPAGTWTDDTAMMLCIASALASTVDPEENRVEQILALREWKDHGVHSSTNVCFDIKPQVKEAIEMFTQHDRPDHALHIIRSNFCGDNDFDNTSGSLSRVLPLSISFWREPDQARIYGKLSSEITHPSLLCKEASSLIAFLIASILQQVVDAPWKSRDEEDKKLSKLTLIHQIARFPFENNDLHKYLTVPFGTGERPTAEDELESWYFRHLPLLRSIVRHQFTDPNPYPSLPFIIPPVDQLQTRDHALDVTLAALYCFFATRNFEEGALMAVNLCGEASTVGAVYASLAAPFYVGDEEKDKLFWTKKVREWRKALQRQDLLEVEARKMIALAYQRLEEERQSA
jgi:ADP-ribosylglycohydrolase